MFYPIVFDFGEFYSIFMASTVECKSLFPTMSKEWSTKWIGIPVLVNLMQPV